MSFEYVKVRDLCEQIRGVSYEKGEALSSPRPGFVPILRSNNITDHGLVYDELVYVPEERVSVHQRLRRFDVVIATSSGSKDVVGKAAPVLDDFDGAFGAFCKVLRPNHKVDPGYFAHFFKTRLYRQRVSALAAGANINNLRNEHLEDLDIPLPNRARQRQIAEVLDRAESLCNTRRKAIARLDELARSTFTEMFGDPVLNPKGWTRLTLREILEGIDSGKSPVCLDRPAAPEEWGILKLGAVTTCEYDDTENKALAPGVEPDPSLEVRPGDLLFSRKNTHHLVAACALVRETRPRLLLSDLIFRLRLKDDTRVDPVYLHHLLIHPTKRKTIQRLAGGSAGSMPNISKEKLRGVEIELPPISLQREFARRIDAIEKLKAQQRASLAQLEALYASLQDRAFRGEL